MIDRGLWLRWPFGFGEIRLSTVGAWLAILLLVGAWRRRPIAAVVLVGAWLFSFEISYNWLETIAHHWGAKESLLFTLGWGGWVAAGLYVTRPDPVALIITAALLAAWVLTGFHVNYIASPHIDALGEALNEGSKTALAIAWVLPLIVGPRAGRRSGAAGRGSPASVRATVPPARA